MTAKTTDADTAMNKIINRKGPKLQAIDPDEIGGFSLNDKDKIIYLRNRGLSIKAIARQLHKSDRLVSKIVKGIKAPAAKTTSKKCEPKAAGCVNLVIDADCTLTEKDKQAVSFLLDLIGIVVQLRLLSSKDKGCKNGCGKSCKKHK